MSYLETKEEGEEREERKCILEYCNNGLEIIGGIRESFRFFSQSSLFYFLLFFINALVSSNRLNGWSIIRMAWGFE